ncbi:remorin [Tripterygium wilfordii]|uniref:Remorin n=1 Tax=Tripterygium wilfordii TaxID=458696 RepID=A0A7J7CUR6_TRIWF|nr:remorin 4.1 [Tripterygium wilfordii]KAF5737699.1 remorin [Tripterygium wilfordii]
MLTTQSHHHDYDQSDDEHVRDIHALTPPHPQPVSTSGPSRRRWDTSGSVRSSSLSMASEVSTENFTSISREFSALVLAGSTINADSVSGDGNNNNSNSNNSNSHNLRRIGEDHELPEGEETNPLAIVPDYSNPLDVPGEVGGVSGRVGGGELSVQRVKKEEVETRISAWQNAKIAKINNRFKREDAVTNGWESEQVHKANSWMKKVERKLEEKRARALEKMQNDVAKARRKAEEKRASAEAKRGTKVARVLEIANLMRAVGRPPVKRSFF